MSARLKPHPAAEILPMLSEPELVALQERLVAAREQLVPAVIFEGKILDGRNREEICHRLGWPLKTITWDEWFRLNKVSVVPPPTPTEWVLSMNLDRRHLNESQRALAAAKALPLLEAEAKKRMQAGKAAPVEAPTLAPRGARLAVPPAEPKATAKLAKGKAAAVAAKAVGASTRSVERAKAVLAKKPELADLIAQGKQTLKQAEKAIRREEQLKNVLEYRPPVGTYGVIVADVPWEYDDQLDGSDQARGGTPYPPMPIEEIMKIKPPAAADCALWFWTTNAFLIDGTAAKVVEAWGFEAKALYTWRKVDKNGNDRLGAGHYGQNVTEHVILAVRGKPVIRGEGQPNIFDAPRTSRHSEKPARFFEIAEKVTPTAPEARIELFAIEERKGWVTSGSEQQAKVRDRRPDAREAAATDDGLTGHSMPRHQYDPRLPEGMGGPHDWHPINSTAERCRRCEVRHSRVGKPRTGCPNAPAESMFDQMRRDPKPAKLSKEEVPGRSSSPGIAWTAKKHPSKVAVGVADSGRRYAVDRVQNAIVGGPDKKGRVRHISQSALPRYRWFCTSDGASSRDEFDTPEQAKVDAQRVEADWLRMKAGAA